MKKLVSIILCLILSISTATLLTGCSATIFDGEYREVDLSEIETLIPEIKSANKKPSINFNNGISLSMNVRTSTRAIKQTESISMKAIKFAGALMSEGKMLSRTDNNISSESDVVHTDFYCSNSTSYLTLTQNDQTLKIKQYKNMIKMLEESLDTILGYLIITDYVELTKNDSSAIWQIDDTQELLKIKLDYTEETGSAKIIWIYNSQYNLIACQFIASSSSGTGILTSSAKVTFSYEPWSGTITPPSDLDSYVTQL